MSYLAEYIWIDGNQPTAKLRSKTKVMQDGGKLPNWGFDGSSTLQASSTESDCVLKPVADFPDPIKGDPHRLVLCEVLTVDMKPHPSNTRAHCVALAKKHAARKAIFGLEQEYTLMTGTRPLEWPVNGFPPPQGNYYCGIGADEVFGRAVVEDHLTACLDAELLMSGINAEVMPAQWEFQIGPLPAPDVADQIWIARWLLYRIAEEHTSADEQFITATLDPKPVPGDWNGAGCHTNFSTEEMRNSFEACEAAAKVLGTKHDLHIKNYGEGIERRLTGKHETATYTKYSYGVSDRSASVRIPWQVAKDGGGYIEDRRPNANCDPYVVTALLIDTVCGA